jgi:5'-3' exonuclease
MGIPSYYKRLIDRYPKLVQKGIRQMTSDILLMDFNCLIYQCVRSDTLPKYTSASRDDWERALIEAVKKYTVKVWETAGKPAQVLIAVDGVVPMAKIRQQRLRRFKSRWLAAEERGAGVRRPDEESWDTNAITPGTEFMEKLGVGLRSLAAARAGWKVSCSKEAGEGEQKVMAWVREQGDKLSGKAVTVYGLDADLIVLSLLAIARNVPGVAGWKLLRELAEFEGGRADGGAFGALDVRELLNILVPFNVPAAEYMLEYVCGMSFLGNDFLPHSLSVKMREGGHDLLRIGLSDIHATGERLVEPDGSVRPRGVSKLLKRWAVTEETWIAENFDHKYKARPMPPRNERDRLMAQVERLPLEWKAESAIWKAESGLISGWEEVYKQKWLHGAGAEQVVGEYLRGLQWIIDYYLGRPVSYSWYFPWNVPPLWKDVVANLEVDRDITAPPETKPVAPQEQLAMVLPMDSWWLLREPRLRSLPARLPAYWPRQFGFFSVGRRWLWECEAQLPILTPERLDVALGRRLQ